MQSEYEISTLYQEAQTRWLKPPEVYFILRNHERYQLTHKPLQKPTSGSLFLFNKRVLKFFRKDGHQWRRKRDGRAIAEAHERLKVGNVEALNCYYAHGEHDPSFQRRIFWILDPEYDHIVLVHYRDVSEGKEGKQTSGTVLQFSLNPSTLFSSQSSIGYQNASDSHHIGDSTDIHHQHSSNSLGGIAEANSGVVFTSNGAEEGSGSSYEFENRQVIKRLEEQLSLGDDNVNTVDPLESLDGLQFLDFSKDIIGHLAPLPATVHQRPESSKLGRCYGGYVGGQYNVNTIGPLYCKNESLDSLLSVEYINDMNQLAQPAPGHQRLESNRLERSYGGYIGVEYHPNNHMLVNNDSGGNGGSGDQESESWKEVMEACGASTALNSEGNTSSQANCLLPVMQEDSNWSYGQGTLLLPQELGSSLQLPACYSELGAPLEQDMRHTVAAYNQKFTIQDISPEWGYANETTKVIIIGSFVCDPTESTWACMFGNAEVPFEIIREGVIRCEAPPCGPGKVNLCITSRDGLSCSQIIEFEYRHKPDTSCHRSNPDELLLLVRFVQTLLTDRKGNLELPGTDMLLADDAEWSHIMETIRDGSATPSSTVDWLLQELLKDKLDAWLSSRSQTSSSLSKQEQGIIHMVAGLGLEWALHPILGHGVNVDFRDSNGWSALHWAAQLGSEKMVAALIASGASPGAVTDPNAQDPVGKTPASLAASNGHKGLAGYLSEVALTNHLSSLTLEETQHSIDTAQVEAEIKVNSIAGTSHPVYDDPQSLAALRNAAQAASRIQAAFRAHSFRKRQQREAAMSACLQEYGMYAADIGGVSGMSFGNARNHHHSAALSIQKKYRGYKGRKEYLTKRQKAVMIQAHVRGYQTRKQYKVICWAVGVIDKVVLRWRRKGVGLKGFRQDVEEDSDEEEDILRVFRKQKVDGAVNEAFSRVLSMTHTPESRQQYHRVLTRYCQKKAELGKTETLGTDGGDDDDLFDIADMEYDNLFSLP